MDLFECIADRAEPAVVERKAVVGLEARLEIPLGAQRAGVIRAKRLRVVEERAVAPDRSGKVHLDLAPFRQIPVEERAVQPERLHRVAPLAFVRVQRGAEPAHRMSGEQQRAADQLDRRIDLGVILAYALAEIRVLLRPQRAAVLAQVERVERIAFGGEALGHVALEEVIAEAVDVERRAARRVACRQAHQGGDDRAVVVGRKFELERLESRQEGVRLPALHAARVPTARVP